jgi:hypothetical protein
VPTVKYTWQHPAVILSRVALSVHETSVFLEKGQVWAMGFKHGATQAFFTSCLPFNACSHSFCFNVKFILRGTSSKQTQTVTLKHICQQFN